MLQDLSTELNLTQIIKTATHKDGNVLDLVFTNNVDLITDNTVIPILLSISHHRLLYTCFHVI